MRVRMFKPQFAPLVVPGSKRQTIRPCPKRPLRVGDMESWRQWSGKPYRSKQIELAKVRIVQAMPITITLNEMNVGGEWLSSLAQDRIAKADGFLGIRDMVGWFNFTHGLPFTGILIRAETL